MQATDLFNHWQELLQPCADAFMPRGFQLFTEWLTGLALNVEEHTITQSLIGLDRPDGGRVLVDGQATDGGQPGGRADAFEARCSMRSIKRACWGSATSTPTGTCRAP